jgi:ubiquitin-like domain-containing CTD phosphatase 1
VVDDFDLDFNAGSDEWLNHVATGENLKKFTEQTEVFFMNPPREGKPLLVLDLDHTLLCFSSKSLQRDAASHAPGEGSAARMKRPYMDEFLTKCYLYYDLVVWSQTSWRWLEVKLTELGMLTHPGYKFCFVLDKTSMFAIQSTKRNGEKVRHHVKPLGTSMTNKRHYSHPPIHRSVPHTHGCSPNLLFYPEIIWSKFDRWNSSNTCHVDDLRRNFALNVGAGLKIKAYYRKKTQARRDAELLGLSNYMEQVAQSGVSFDEIDFDDWERVVAGLASLVTKKDG